MLDTFQPTVKNTTLIKILSFLTCTNRFNVLFSTDSQLSDSGKVVAREPREKCVLAPESTIRPKRAILGQKYISRLLPFRLRHQRSPACLQILT